MRVIVKQYTTYRDKCIKVVTGEYLGVTSKTVSGYVVACIVLVNFDTNKIETYEIGGHFEIEKIKE